MLTPPVGRSGPPGTRPVAASGRTGKFRAGQWLRARWPCGQRRDRRPLVRPRLLHWWRCSVDASAYRWVAATTGSNNAAGLVLSSGEAVWGSAVSTGAIRPRRWRSSGYVAQAIHYYVAQHPGFPTSGGSRPPISPLPTPSPTTCNTLPSYQYPILIHIGTQRLSPWSSSHIRPHSSLIRGPVASRLHQPYHWHHTSLAGPRQYRRFIGGQVPHSTTYGSAIGFFGRARLTNPHQPHAGSALPGLLVRCRRPRRLSSRSASAP